MAKRSPISLPRRLKTSLISSSPPTGWPPAVSRGEDAALFDTVRAVGMELCPALGLSIPVGKDSLSMRTTWNEDGADKAVTSPVSLIGLVVCAGVRHAQGAHAATANGCRGDGAHPHRSRQRSEPSRRIGTDASDAANRQRGTGCRQRHRTQELLQRDSAAQCRRPNCLPTMTVLMAVCLPRCAKMAFAARCGLDIELDTLIAFDRSLANAHHKEMAVLFSEELGAVHRKSRRKTRTTSCACCARIILTP